MSNNDEDNEHKREERFVNEYIMTRQWPILCNGRRRKQELRNCERRK